MIESVGQFPGGTVQLTQAQHLPGFMGYVPVEAFNRNHFPAIADSENYFFTLAPHDYQWFVLERVNPDAVTQSELPAVRINDWSNFLANGSRSKLESGVLPDYLR